MKPLVEVQYLPSVAYFSAVCSAEKIILEKYEHYVKQSYRNRCCINTSQGKDLLIIPVTNKHGKVAITDVQIDYNQKWLNNHWRTIVSAYGKAPFFEFYADDLEAVLFKKYTYLYDLNVNLLSLCLKWLKLSMPIEETLSYTKTVDTTVTDLRSLINTKKTDNLYKFYKPVVYYQVFGNTFVENLSIVDLIFCCGPEAARIVQASRRNEQI